jgi:hypothetical protein
MTFRRRLGVLATVASGLLVAGLLLSAPAFAWDTTISGLHTRCPSNPHPDQTRVAFDVKLFQKGHSGSFEVFYKIDEGDSTAVPSSGLLDDTGKPHSTFGPDDEFLHLHFLVPSPTEEGHTISIKVVTHFDDSKETPVSKAGPVKLEVCTGEGGGTTTTTTTEAPATTAAPTTTAGAIGGVTTSSSGGGSLPFTGSNPVPMLIGALVLLLGGGSLLLAGRLRARQVK